MLALRQVVSEWAGYSAGERNSSSAIRYLDHPKIARVLDGGTTDVGRPYFVMELVKGISITKYCDEARSSTEERLGLFIDVCEAVQQPIRRA